MTGGWAYVITVSGVTMLFKAAGGLVPSRSRAEQGRETGLRDMTQSLLPAVLSALIAKELFTHGTSLSLDARVAGVAVALLATSLRASPVVAIVAAVATTILLRRSG
jgi:hypothetical protein